MTNITMIPVTGSSQIQKVGYDELDEYLYVTFSRGGNTYRYRGVPENVYNDFMSSPSRGTYFHCNIKTQYHAEKIDMVGEDK